MHQPIQKEGKWYRSCLTFVGVAARKQTKNIAVGQIIKLLWLLFPYVLNFLNTALLILFSHLFMWGKSFLSSVDYCSDTLLLFNESSRVVQGFCVAVRHPGGRVDRGSVAVLVLISFLCNSVSSVRLKIGLSSEKWNWWLKNSLKKGRRKI